MGIEEIKKANEEAKKTFTRPSQKVAALLIALGPTTASEVLKNIRDEDLLEQITLDIANLGKISDEELNEVLSEFRTVFQAKNYITQGGFAYAKQLLAQAYSEQEAAHILEKVNAMVNFLTKQTRLSLQILLLQKTRSYWRLFLHILNRNYRLKFSHFYRRTFKQLFQCE